MSFLISKIKTTARNVSLMPVCFHHHIFDLDIMHKMMKYSGFKCVLENESDKDLFWRVKSLSIYQLKKFELKYWKVQGNHTTKVKNFS